MPRNYNANTNKSNGDFIMNDDGEITKPPPPQKKSEFHQFGGGRQFWHGLA